MAQRKFALRIGGAILVLALSGAACADTEVKSDTNPGSDATTMEDNGSGPVAIDSGAPALAQALTSLLDSHVYQAGITVVQGVSNGLDSPEFAAAAAQLDENSVALADAIGSVYGDEARNAFLPLWRKHIGFFVDYTAAQATGDKQAAMEAKTNLDGYRTDFGELIEGATGGKLPADAVADALIPHVQSLFDTIDSVVAGDGMAFDLLREAAGHMPMTATTLAGGIAASMPDAFPGATADGAASQLQVGLTHLLDDHVYLAGIAISTGLSAGLDSPEFEAAAAALDINTVALADTIDSVYPGAKESFLPLWRKHIGFFVDYTVAQASGDKMGAEKARTALDGYRQDFGELIEGATEGGVSADDIAEGLKVHVETLFAAIDALVAGDAAGAFSALNDSAHHNTILASVLAGTIVKQFPEQFSN